MSFSSSKAASAAAASAVHPLKGSKDLDVLLDRIGNARVAMLGEASHGTHEYYTWRTAITKRLITEKGFSFIAVEGDWPDCYRINRFIKGFPDSGSSAVEVLKQFKRWPTWMWANWEIAALIEWLREYNSERPAEKQVGFYGLDVYSLWESLDVMLKYLQKEDPDAAEKVQQALDCFEPFEQKGRHYGYSTTISSEGCRREVLDLLTEIRSKAKTYDNDPEASLNIEQNAYVATGAEQYYRSMVGFNNESWNVRDTHMMETLKRLLTFHGDKGKAIVWEHNTHIGDARATSMKSRGRLNIGQLGREELGEKDVVLIGFCCHSGTVIAGSAWGAPMQVMPVPRAAHGSIEDVLHTESTQNRIIVFNQQEKDERFSEAIGHRAIGVVYRPERDRGNYVPSILSNRYDALIFLDRTKALHPMHLKPSGHEIPDTYPFGV